MKGIDDIKKVAIIGAGTMGADIAMVTAQAGYQTVLYDLASDATVNGFETIKKNLAVAVKRGKIQHVDTERIFSIIKISNDFKDLVVDLAIEAIVENVETKKELFNQLSAQNDSDTLFCTNTSSIPIKKIAEGISNPERIVGMHFFNPAYVMKLVEVVSGRATSKENALTIFEFAKKLGKEPVMVKDVPGFIVNRIGKLYHTEPLKILEENIASVETIDSLLEALGFKMGPFKLIDLIGVDVNLKVTKSLYEQLGYQPRFRPSPIQQQLVDSGYLGRKAGRGFYQY